jgi:hypothetical protein
MYITLVLNLVVAMNNSPVITTFNSSIYLCQFQHFLLNKTPAYARNTDNPVECPLWQHCPPMHLFVCMKNLRVDKPVLIKFNSGRFYEKLSSNFRFNLDQTI